MKYLLVRCGPYLSHILTLALILGKTGHIHTMLTKLSTATDLPQNSLLFTQRTVRPQGNLPRVQMTAISVTASTHKYCAHKQQFASALLTYTLSNYTAHAFLALEEFPQSQCTPQDYFSPRAPDRPAHKTHTQMMHKGKRALHTKHAHKQEQEEEEQEEVWPKSTPCDPWCLTGLLSLTATGVPPRMGPVPLASWQCLSPGCTSPVGSSLVPLTQ